MGYFFCSWNRKKTIYFIFKNSMEKYSLENAQSEATVIRNDAQEAKQKRVLEGEKSGEPNRAVIKNL